MADIIGAVPAANFTELVTDINAANAETTAGTYTIQIDGAVDLAGALPQVNLAAGVTLDIVGENGATLDGGGAQAGLYVYSGNVSISDLMKTLYQARKTSVALAGGDRAAALAAAASMEAALAADNRAADPEQQVVACMQLGRFWSQRDRSRAFAFWTQAHARLRPFQPFSRAAHLAFLEANIGSFPPARFKDGPRAANDDPAPVFIVGMPRSGTTLCEQIIGAHAQAFAAGERSALRDAFRRLAGGLDPAAVERLAARRQPGLDLAATAYLEELHGLSPASQRIVDKMPGNTDVLALTGLMLPGARIIHCVRDPRDIGLSIFARRFVGNHPYAHDLADLGWSIGQSLRIMAHWKSVLPNPILTLRMDDWVHDFDGTLGRVLDHLDLPPDPGCADFYKSDAPVKTASKWQVREPINARGLGRWKRYATELAPMIVELDAAGALAGWEGGAAEAA